MSEFKKNPEENKQTESGANKKQAIEFIGYALQKMAMAGENGAEYGAVSEVLRQLEADEISPEVAQAKMSEIGIANINELGKESEGPKKEAEDYIFQVLTNIDIEKENSKYLEVANILKKLREGEIGSGAAKEMTLRIAQGK